MAKILIVDDDDDIRELVSRNVRNHGHQVVAVASAAEALSVVADRGAPDLAILDVAMPEMDGFELLAALRERDGLQELPVTAPPGLELEADAPPVVSRSAARRPRIVSVGSWTPLSTWPRGSQ